MPDDPADAFYGRLTGYLEKSFPPAVYGFYLCGKGEMIRDATLLVDELFPESIVYTETSF